MPDRRSQLESFRGISDLSMFTPAAVPVTAVGDRRCGGDDEEDLSELYHRRLSSIGIGSRSSGRSGGGCSGSGGGGTPSDLFPSERSSSRSDVAASADATPSDGGAATGGGEQSPPPPLPNPKPNLNLMPQRRISLTERHQRESLGGRGGAPAATAALGPPPPNEASTAGGEARPPTEEVPSSSSRSRIFVLFRNEQINRRACENDFLHGFYSFYNL